MTFKIRLWIWLTGIRDKDWLPEIIREWIDVIRYSNYFSDVWGT